MTVSKTFLISLHIVSTLALILAMGLIHVVLNDESNRVHNENLKENIESHDVMQQQSTNLHTGPIAEQHTNMSKEIHDLTVIVNKILDTEGGVDEHIAREDRHFNQTIEVAQILAEYVKSVNNTDTTTGNSTNSSS